MKYVLITLIALAIIMPSCSLRKENKKQSVHHKRKASQRKAYATDPGIGYTTTP